jgi:regulator of cell morphogenesis and NO signaling
MMSYSNPYTQRALTNDFVFNLLLDRIKEEHQQPGRVNHAFQSDFQDEELSFLIEVMIAFEKVEEFDAEKFMSFSVPVILRYLQNTHKYYLGRRLMEIEQSIHQLSVKRGSSNPFVKALETFYHAYRQELAEHIEMEEKDLFPYIRFLLDAEKKGLKLSDFYRHHGKYCIDQFISEHDESLEEQLNEVYQQVVKFDPDIRSSLAFSIFETQLVTFRKDLEVHALLEDRVLIPKARVLEQKLAKS